MELKQIMEQRSFVIVGDTLNEEKYAYRIKHAMRKNGYAVQCVGKELSSINDTVGEIDVIDLCVRAEKGLALLRECSKPFKCVVIQPGASGEELLRYLQEKQIPYINSCLLAGLGKYGPDQN